MSFVFRIALSWVDRVLNIGDIPANMLDYNFVCNYGKHRSRFLACKLVTMLKQHFAKMHLPIYFYLQCLSDINRKNEIDEVNKLVKDGWKIGSAIHSIQQNSRYRAHKSTFADCKQVAISYCRNYQDMNRTVALGYSDFILKARNAKLRNTYLLLHRYIFPIFLPTDLHNDKTENSVCGFLSALVAHHWKVVSQSQCSMLLCCLESKFRRTKRTFLKINTTPIHVQNEIDCTKKL